MISLVKSIKALICIFLCVLTVASFAGCSKESESSAVITTAAPTTQPVLTTVAPTTAPPTTPATDDTPTQPATYNYVKIKEKTDELMTQFDKFVASGKFKGIVYYKIGNDFEYIGKDGMAIAEDHMPNSINTDYYIGSVTKQFTAAAIMMLAEQDKLSVDDTLDKYYPDYEYGSKISIKNLLTMTSGIKSYMCVDGSIDSDIYAQSQLGYKVSSKNSAKQNKKAIMDWIFAQKLLFEPDTEFRFSDSNYYILGDIIEIVSGEKYEDFVEENIFKPVGMNSTSFSATDNLACGYDGNRVQAWISYKGVAYSSTGMISTVSDLLKWVYALDEYKILSEESVNEMFTPYLENYGYGTFIYGNRASQTGNFNEFSSMLAYTRDEEEIYVSLSNYGYSDPVHLFAMLKKTISPYYG